VLLVGLRRTQEDLAGRIEERTRAMVEGGLLDEVRGLLGRGVPPDAKPLAAIGYRQMVAHLEGRASLAEAARQIARDTRRYAKRQMTWFRREPGLVWVDLRPETAPSIVAGEILDRLGDPAGAAGSFCRAGATGRGE
jgi:tRNA dimethylallyltransferase